MQGVRTETDLRVKLPQSEIDDDDDDDDVGWWYAGTPCHRWCPELWPFVINEYLGT